MPCAPQPSAAHRELKAALQALVGPVQSARTLHAKALSVWTSEPLPPLAVPDERIVLIDDDEDPTVPPLAREPMRQRYRGAEHHMLAGGGHCPTILSAEADAGVIRRRLVGQ